MAKKDKGSAAVKETPKEAHKVPETNCSDCKHDPRNGGECGEGTEMISKCILSNAGGNGSLFEPVEAENEAPAEDGEESANKEEVNQGETAKAPELSLADKAKQKAAEQKECEDKEKADAELLKEKINIVAKSISRETSRMMRERGVIGCGIEKVQAEKEKVTVVFSTISPEEFALFMRYLKERVVLGVWPAQGQLFEDNLNRRAEAEAGAMYAELPLTMDGPMPHKPESLKDTEPKPDPEETPEGDTEPCEKGTPCDGEITDAAEVICPVCGGIAERENLTKCERCGKEVCAECVVTNGDGPDENDYCRNCYEEMQAGANGAS